MHIKHRLQGVLYLEQFLIKLFYGELELTVTVNSCDSICLLLYTVMDFIDNDESSHEASQVACNHGVDVSWDVCFVFFFFPF